MTPPVPFFTRTDCELLARYGNARVRWPRVDTTSRRKLADVRERVKQLIATAAHQQHTGLRLAQFTVPTHTNDRVPADYWGCLYPASIPGKAFALQLTIIISSAGAELALTMGSERRDARDPKAAAQNRRALEEAQQQLAALPLNAAAAFEEQIGPGWRYRRSPRRPARAADFESFAEWAQYAASPLGAGASISCNLSPSTLDKLGDSIVERFVQMTTVFAPVLQYVYGEDTSSDAQSEDLQNSNAQQSEDSSLPDRRTSIADDIQHIAGTIGKLPGIGHSERTPALARVAEQAPEYHTTPPNSSASRQSPRPYTLDQATTDLFVPREELAHMVTLLGRRRNLMIEGPPGVGKTFVARRLAYTILGETDTTRLEMVQFHPSYSYEDFVQGWRPAAGGSFVLRNGVFYEFCRAARSDPDRAYVFVIDEINRGNVSAVFGELLMLLERDKRGDEFAVPLTYAMSRTDRFAIPSNVYVIATMNTADRSVAMVDYALRRRFAFTRLHPAFDSPSFATYLAKLGVPKSLARRIASRMTTLNEEIVDDRKRLGPGFEIGHSPFVPIERGTYDETWYHDIVHTEIEPLLREYWFDDPERASEAVARLLA